MVKPTPSWEVATIALLLDGALALFGSEETVAVIWVETAATTVVAGNGLPATFCAIEVPDN